MFRGSLAVLAFLSISMLDVEPTSADALCWDGWYSAADGQGACSWHNGVQQWLMDGTVLVEGYLPTFSAPSLAAPTFTTPTFPSEPNREEPWWKKNWLLLASIGAALFAWTNDKKK